MSLTCCLSDNSINSLEEAKEEIEFLYDYLDLGLWNKGVMSSNKGPRLVTPLRTEEDTSFFANVILNAATNGYFPIRYNLWKQEDENIPLLYLK